MSSQPTDSFERAQEEVLTGKKRKPDDAAIRRHQEYQYQLRHGKRLIPFLLARVAMIVLGIVSAAVGFYLLLSSASEAVLALGVVLLFGGFYLALRGLLGKRVGLDDIFYTLP